MNLKTSLFMAILAGGLAACATPDPVRIVITDLTADETPADVRVLAERGAPGFVISEVQQKVRGERTYYDVEGTLPDGSEIEFDILMTVNGPEIVEIQRDLDWAAVPDAVQAAARSAAPGIVPARVIESTQTDGKVIYELFAPGAPADPTMEVSWTGGVAAVLSERWPH